MPYDLIIADNMWNLFTHFFRMEKGREDWTDEQIELSYNNDDVCEFIKWLSERESKEIKPVVIAKGEKNYE